ncbi:DUF1259 domain-containing protein [Sphingomonas aerophila]|jgi:hypothetical protein|uniref:Peptidase M23 n=1 Tax=Sphingomonas aerophila TaxID=1344948 RepID=A0A7W9BCT1_9SPHN|nr:DUF1259 domain-containing protein [Sphingomonas aerophila]MBB5714865.1 hypothetical protein [Sphingomonas aerophila]
MLKKLLIASALAASSAAPAWAAPNWTAVDQALGRPGTEQPGGVHRYGFPRSDLKVTLDGVAIKPALALGSWAAFQPMGDDVMVMGDLVLTQEEVNPVMSRLLASGFTITALHNHLLRSSPATMYLHIGAHGDPVKIAQALHGALAVSGTPLAAPSRDSQPPAAGAGSSPPLDLDTSGLDQAMGAKGKANGGVYQFSFPRAEKLMAGGMPAPATMGMATAINFQPTGGGKAAITGDFVMVAREVDPVMRALRANGIEVTALHNHMLDDEPRLFFMHFWANQDASKLARGLRTALNEMNIQKP